ncbi:hypothetical protein Rsub_00280 [Raphidocelis subcapitata]|uniref:PNPLA domain-containing protein n=1 Tax=Raphidocelis subcapitata TaxID=307507 RepID=A0A2V0NKN7_9CHLO|nr:hypothetical protein Rsub_00280 [Raphidocelis subcapitata]|eukprot:GBF87569.1 hypothetical protein Rsub_00280 [Raphidocelis subcapitata]
MWNASLPGAAAGPVVHPAVQAWRSGTLDLGFSGSGFLLFYFLGVLQSLFDLGIASHSTRMAGSSGGALTAVGGGCGGVAPAVLLRDLTATAEACRAAEQCYHTLDAAVRARLDSTLPADAAARCSSRGFVAVTRADPTGPDEPLLLGERYHNKSDVVAAAAASSFLPYWSAPSPFTTVRAFEAYDGGFTAPLPCPPPEGNSTYCAIAQFRALSRYNTEGNVTSPAPELDPLPGPPPPEVDIAPGKPGLSPLPFPPATWDSFSLTSIPNATAARLIFDTGAADAAQWARAVGLEAAAAAGARGGRRRARGGAGAAQRQRA